MAQWIKRATYLLLLIGMVWLLFIVVSRLFFPYLASYKSYFETQASNLLHRPVSIGQMQISWKGLHPIIAMHNICIAANTSGPDSALAISRLQIEVKIIASLWQHRLVPNKILLIGTHLTIHSPTTHSLEINGILIPLTGYLWDNPNQNIDRLFKVFLQFPQLHLQDVTIDWQAKNSIQHLHLEAELKHTLLHHHLVGLITAIDDPSSRLHFIIHLKHTFFNKKNIQAKIYIALQNIPDVGYIQPVFLDNFRVSNAKLQTVQLWGFWKNHHWQQIQGKVQLKNIQLSHAQLIKPLFLSTLAANFFWQYMANNTTHLIVDHVQLGLNQQIWPVTQLTIDTSNGTQLIGVDFIDIKQLSTALLYYCKILPFKLHSYLLALQPEGKLQNIWVQRLLTGKNTFLQLFGSTQFTQLKTAAWQQFPGFKDLTGHVTFSPNKGVIHLTGKHLIVTEPAWFNHAFLLNNYKGSIQWIKTAKDLQVQLKDFNLEDAHTAIRTTMKVWFTDPNKEPYVQLFTNFSMHDLRYFSPYIPVGILSHHAGFLKWLQSAFVDGDGIEGQVLLQGNLNHFPFDDHTGHFEALVNITNSTLNYKTGWPILSHLNASALFSDRSLHIQVNHGQILNHILGPIQADIANLGQAELKIQGSVQSDLLTGRQFILQSPLKVILGKALEKFTINGQMQLHLALDIPLYQTGQTKIYPPIHVLGNVKLLPETTLTVPCCQVYLNHLRGQFQFTEAGLYANTLSANWLDQPVTFNITTKPLPTGHSIQIQAKGNSNVQQLALNYGLNLHNIIQGKTNYTALLQIKQQKQNTQTALIIHSDLTGVAINLPEPLYKSTLQKGPLDIIFKPISEKSECNVWTQYAKVGSVALSFATEKLQLKRGNIRFGEKLAEFQTLDGLLIDGNLAHLKWSDIAPFIFTDHIKSLNTTSKIRKIDMNIDQLEAFGIHLPMANVRVLPQLPDWSVSIQSPTVNGELTIPTTDFTKPISGNFENFQLLTTDITADTEAKQFSKSTDPSNATYKITQPKLTKGFNSKLTSPISSPILQKNSINPGHIPPLDLFFKHFYLGSKDLGTVSLLTTSGKNKCDIQRLRIDTVDTHLLATGSWQQWSNHQQTTLHGVLKSDNSGNTVNTWQRTTSIVGGQGAVVFALSWPSAPYAINVKQFNGDFSLDFSNGSIINIGENNEREIGIGRLLNVLSLTSIARRLTFDFSDLLAKGFNFKHIQGDWRIQSGNLTTQNSILEGDIAKIAITGRIGLATHAYDLKMLITPYTTDSLPVAAGLISGPLIGAAMWLGNELFSSFVNQLMTQTYLISGIWEKPIIQAIN